MRKQIILLNSLLLLLAVTQAQIPPQAFNYSAVARDASNNPIADTVVGIQISIRQTSNTGAIVYKENHFVNTDNFGLFNLVIGAGNVQSGSMSSIEWAADDHYLEVGMDVNGGTNFLIMGTTQLLSVPYALYAKTAGSIDSAGDRYVGELYGGGVVFWVDHTGQHGLILSMVDLSTSRAWSNITNTFIGTTDWDGAANTLAIIGQSGHTSSAAQLCVDYTNDDYGTGVYSDWYLPSAAEFYHLWTNYTVIQKALISAAAIPLERTYYWSSTEYSEGGAFAFIPVRIGGNFVGPLKYHTCYVRAVRAF